MSFNTLNAKNERNEQKYFNVSHIDLGFCLNFFIEAKIMCFEYLILQNFYTSKIFIRLIKNEEN